MGHKDVESISRYLAPLKGKAMRAKVEDIWNKKPVCLGSALNWRGGALR